MEKKKQFNVPNVPEEALKEAKIRAIREGKTLSKVVREFVVKYSKGTECAERKMEWESLE